MKQLVTAKLSIHCNTTQLIYEPAPSSQLPTPGRKRSNHCNSVGTLTVQRRWRPLAGVTHHWRRDDDDAEKTIKQRRENCKKRSENSPGLICRTYFRRFFTCPGWTYRTHFRRFFYLSRMDLPNTFARLISHECVDLRSNSNKIIRIFDSLGRPRPQKSVDLHRLRPGRCRL